MGADAGGDGVDVGVLGPDSHLGAGAGLAADGLDLDGAVIDLGHLQLEQTLDEAGVGAADHDAGAALAGHHINDALLGVNAGDGGLHDVVGAGLDLAQLLAALGLADALTDDVLCGLGGDAAEVLGLEGGHDPVAHLIALADVLCLGDADLAVLVVPVLVGHDVLNEGDVELAGLGVDLDHDVVVLDLIVLLHGNDDSSLDLVDQVLCRNAALVLQHGESFKKFVVRCCHFSGSS